MPNIAQAVENDYDSDIDGDSYTTADERSILESDQDFEQWSEDEFDGNQLTYENSSTENSNTLEDTSIEYNRSASLTGGVPHGNDNCSPEKSSIENNQSVSLTSNKSHGDDDDSSGNYSDENNHSVSLVATEFHAVENDLLESTTSERHEENDADNPVATEHVQMDSDPLAVTTQDIKDEGSIHFDAQDEQELEDILHNEHEFVNWKENDDDVLVVDTAMPQPISELNFWIKRNDALCGNIPFKEYVSIKYFLCLYMNFK